MILEERASGCGSLFPSPSSAGLAWVRLAIMDGGGIGIRSLDGIPAGIGGTLALAFKGGLHLYNLERRAYDKARSTIDQMIDAQARDIHSLEMHQLAYYPHSTDSLLDSLAHDEFSS
jgi:hypothetical protein